MGLMQKINFTFLILMMFMNATFAMNAKIDSLKNIIHTANISDSLKIEAMISLGVEYKYVKPDTAKKYFNRALSEAEKTQIILLQAKANNGMGGVNYILGAYDFSLDYFYRAQQLYKNIGHKKGVAISYNNIGLIQNMQKKYYAAIANHKKSIEMCKQIADTNFWATNLHNLGIVYNNIETENKQDSALLFARQGQELFYAIGQKNQAMRINNLFAEIYFNQKEYKEAKKASLEILNTKDFTNDWEKVYALTNLARADFYLKNYKNSIDWGLNAFQMGEELNTKWDLKEASKILSDAYAALGDWENAYKYLAEHKEYADQIFNESKNKEINYLHLKAEQNKNNILQKENQLKQKIIDGKNRFIITVSIAIILLIIVAFVLFRNNQLKNTLNKELQKKNHEIEERNKQLSELIATREKLIQIIAHDLKNPISVMVSFTDLIKDNLEELDTETILGFMQSLNKSSKEGFKLLENLLEWARSQTGEMNAKKEQLNMASIAQEAIEYMENMAQKKNIQIESHIDNKPNPSGDRNMTSTIIRNLLANAIKFTHKNGHVKLHYKTDDTFYHFCVSDNGIGIKKEDIHKLFSLDETKSSRGTDNEKGTGLGLIICKELAHKQNGTLSVESKEGEGSCFCISIPLAHTDTLSKR